MLHSQLSAGVAMSTITTVTDVTAVHRADVAAAALGLRTMGVEDEYLLVDAATGRPLPLASRVVAGTAGSSSAQGVQPLDTELQQEQVESRTPPRSSLAELAADLRVLRRQTDARARVVGGRLAAL